MKTENEFEYENTFTTGIKTEQMPNNAYVNAIRHTDVKGNTQLWLQIQTNEGEILIKIGSKTYNKIKQITGEKDQ